MKKILCLFTLLTGTMQLPASYTKNQTAYENFHANMHQGTCPVGKESMQGHEILNAKKLISSKSDLYTKQFQQKTLTEENETAVSVYALQSFTYYRNQYIPTTIEETPDYQEEQ